MDDLDHVKLEAGQLAEELGLGLEELGTKLGALGAEALEAKYCLIVSSSEVVLVEKSGREVSAPEGFYAAAKAVDERMPKVKKQQQRP